MKARLHLIVFLAAAAPAWAQDRPALTPTRDVSITYRATTEGQPSGEMRMSWLAARHLMRMDLPGGQGWIIVDSAAGSAFMVTEAQRMIMDMPGSSASARVTPSANARFTREGNARVAGMDCVNWRVEDQGQVARTCLTSDGVMLRTESLSGQGPGRGTLEATAIVFGPQDAARFQRPAGYQTMQLPTGMGGGGGPGGGSGGSMPRGTALPPPGITR